MDMRKTILEEHTKTNCLRIVHYVGSDSKRFDELFQIFLNDVEIRVVQRAAWPLSYCVIQHPKFITKHFAALFKNLQKTNILEAVKRNTLRLLQFIDIPKKYHALTINTCFDYIISSKEKPAIKAFSITILQNLSQIYPDLKQELKIIIEERMHLESAAFKSRAKKFIKEI